MITAEQVRYAIDVRWSLTNARIRHGQFFSPCVRAPPPDQPGRRPGGIAVAVPKGVALKLVRTIRCWVSQPFAGRGCCQRKEKSTLGTVRNGANKPANQPAEYSLSSSSQVGTVGLVVSYWPTALRTGCLSISRRTVADLYPTSSRVLTMTAGV